MSIMTGKVVIITGASSGIGRAAAARFAAAGASVVCGARRAEELDVLVRRIRADGGRAEAVPGDVTDPSYQARLVDAAVSTFGRLDAAFNNAGSLGEMGRITGVSLSGWNRTLETNLTAGYLAASQQVPAMREGGGGSIIFTTTFVGHTAGLPGMAAYAASKAGLLGLVQVLAAEYGGENIRVNALVPGGTDTPMGAEVAGSPETRAYVEGLHALGRLAQPEEIADAALFLASDQSAFVTGSALRADGGVSIHRPAG